MPTDAIYKIAFSMLSGVNGASGRRILDIVGTEEQFFSLKPEYLGSMLGLTSKIISRDYRDGLMRKAEDEARFVEAHGIRLFYFADEAYPQRLQECEDAPLMLYGLGDCDLDNKFALSIVGTRHATPYGIDFTQKAISELAASLAAKPMITSGLAFGIDIAAHRAALKSASPTVAVLAHGLKSIYPAVHRLDATAIIDHGGMLLTEYTSDAPVHRGNFLARNRIVAGLSDGTLVAESAVKGGAMVTASIAAAYSREVMALPGRISDSYSAGCNHLIRSNMASLVTSAEDIANTLGWHMETSPIHQNTLPLALDPEEQAVVDLLTERGEATTNQIAIASGFSISRTMSLLIDMEFKGLIICYPGSRYRLA